MQLLFDIKRSLAACPPEKQHNIDKPNGVIFLERKAGKLSALIRENTDGKSLQPREKEKEENRAEGETLSFKQDGVLYEKEVIVVELRADGKLELISGYNRVDHLIETYGDDIIYFYDVVQFESPFYKTMWKRRYNSGPDHRAQGVPNTKGDYVKGLNEAKNNNSFDSTDDDAVRFAIDFMAKGKKSPTQVEAILDLFRQTNSKEVGIRALNTTMANADAKKLGLPTGGYIKNLSNPCFGECGFTRYGGDFKSKIAQWIDIIDQQNVVIQIIGFVQFASHDKIDDQRQKWMDDFNTTLDWLRDHGLGKYVENFKVIGFLAQITTDDKSQGGKPKERGLVDIKGNIIKE